MIFASQICHRTSCAWIHTSQKSCLLQQWFVENDNIRGLGSESCNTLFERLKHWGRNTPQFRETSPSIGVFFEPRRPEYLKKTDVGTHRQDRTQSPGAVRQQYDCASPNCSTCQQLYYMLSVVEFEKNRKREYGSPKLLVTRVICSCSNCVIVPASFE